MNGQGWGLDLYPFSPKEPQRIMSAERAEEKPSPPYFLQWFVVGWWQATQIITQQTLEILTAGGVNGSHRVGAGLDTQLCPSCSIFLFFLLGGGCCGCFVKKVFQRMFCFLL